MRSARLLIVLSAVVYFLVLVNGPTLQSAPQSECQVQPPAPDWVCVNGGWVPPGHPFTPPIQPAPPAQSTPTVTTQVISVGEEVTGTLNLFTTNFPQQLFALTAPADGTVIFHLSGDQGLTIWVTDDPSLSFEAWSQIFVGESLHVFAGVTYLVAVEDCCPWDRLIPVDNPFLPFVLTTSFEAGQLAEPLPVVTPPACESLKPGSEWVCFNGGWVPLGHPLLDSAPMSPPLQPAAASAPVPALSNGCTTPDPFLGITGLFGVCVNGGWVPVGHPLAGGGG